MTFLLIFPIGLYLVGKYFVEYYNIVFIFVFGILILYIGVILLVGLSSSVNENFTLAQGICSKDGKMGYITDTGIIKQYSSPKSLTVLNGCTTSYEQLNAEWDKLGFPIGSAMIDGQSCGNETKYIQSKPPSNNFDWKYCRLIGYIIVIVG